MRKTARNVWKSPSEGWNHNASWTVNFPRLYPSSPKARTESFRHWAFCYAMVTDLSQFPGHCTQQIQLNKCGKIYQLAVQVAGTSHTVINRNRLRMSKLLDYPGNILVFIFNLMSVYKLHTLWVNLHFVLTGIACNTYTYADVSTSAIVFSI